MVRAADFAHWNGDVSRWTVGYSVRQGTKMPRNEFGNSTRGDAKLFGSIGS